jgi:hypothetical protein
LRYSNGIEREDMGIMVQQIREADKWFIYFVDDGVIKKSFFLNDPSKAPVYSEHMEII